MRIHELELNRYGHFTDKHFALPQPADGAPDIHVVHGPNEAGKSTISSAIVDLLYGVPPRTNYAFLHSKRVLEVSTILETETHRHALKRVNRKLLDTNGLALDEQVIDTHNLSREDYIAKFWLDDATLQQGGESILNHKGDVGAALFAATTGLNTLSRQLDELLESTDAFYKPGKRTNLRVKALSDELKQVRAEIRNQDTNRSAWATLKKTQVFVTDELACHTTVLQDLQTRLRQQENIKSALIGYHDWENNRREIEDGGTALPSHWLTDFPQLREEHQTLSGNIMLFTCELEQSTMRADELDIDERWNEFQVPLEGIKDSTQTFQEDLKAEADTARALNELNETLTQRRSTLEGFPVNECNDVNTIPADVMDRLDPLIEQWKDSAATLRQLTTSHYALSARLDAMNASVDPSYVVTSVDGTTEPDDANAENDTAGTNKARDSLDRLLSTLEHGPGRELLQDLKSQNDRLKDCEQRADRLLSDLVMGAHTEPGELRALILPSISRIDACIQQRNELAAQLDAVRNSTRLEKQKLANAEQRLSALGISASEGSDDANQLRSRLLTAWESHRSDIDKNAHRNTLMSSAHEFQAQLNTYFQSVDKRLANAENAGQIIEILKSKKDTAAQLVTMENDARSLKIQQQHLFEQHAQLIAHLPGLSFDDPGALKAGLNALSAWQDADKDASVQRKRTAGCIDDCDRYANELDQLIDTVLRGDYDASTNCTETLAEKLARATRVAARCEKARDEHQRVSTQINELKSDLSNIVLDMERERNRQQANREECLELLESTWVSDVPFDRVCVRWNELKNFSTTFRETQVLEKRYRKLADRVDELWTRTQELADALLPKTGGESTDATPDAQRQLSRLLELNRFHEQQKKRYAEQTHHAERISDYDAKLKRAQADLKTLELKLAPLQNHFDTTDLNVVQRGMDTARRLQQRQEEQNRLQKSICEQLGCASFEAAQKEIKAAIDTLLDVDEDTEARARGTDRPEDASAASDAGRAGAHDAQYSLLRQRMEEALSALNVSVQSADQQRMDTQARLIDIERQLKEVALDEKIAHLRQQEADLEHEIEDGVMSALRRRLGFQAITTGLRHFRQQNRSEMLTSARRAFTALTGGRYTDLVTRPGPKNNTEELIATRDSGKSVLASEMSTGTRYQLYLALRIASYHEYRRRRRPLPFIADDIFETFDESRTEHAFNEFAQMGRYGQIIYFTHHRHVAEIASRVIPGINIVELAP